MMNTRCSRENTISQHPTFDSARKQAVSIDNQREHCLHCSWAQCYQSARPIQFSLLANFSSELPFGVAFLLKHSRQLSYVPIELGLLSFVEYLYNSVFL